MKNLISKNSKAFVIAEIANTHEGNFDELKSLISQVSKTGADAVKFQKFRAEELVKKENKNFRFYKKLEMTDSEWDKISPDVIRGYNSLLPGWFAVSCAKKLKIPFFLSLHTQYDYMRKIARKEGLKKFLALKYTEKLIDKISSISSEGLE